MIVSWERAYQLSQEFVMMLAERREADLDPWLTQAERSGLPEFKNWRMASARMMQRSKRRFLQSGAMVRMRDMIE